MIARVRLLEESGHDGAFCPIDITGEGGRACELRLRAPSGAQSDVATPRTANVVRRADAAVRRGRSFLYTYPIGRRSNPARRPGYQSRIFRMRKPYPLIRWEGRRRAEFPRPAI